MRTGRVLVLLLVLSIAVPADATAASERHASGKQPATRVITIPYSQPCAVALTAAHPYFITSCPDQPDQEQFIVVKDGESSATLEITDASGRMVGLLFRQSYAGVYTETRATICGTSSRLAIDGVQYTANPAVLLRRTDCPYPPTSGVIKVTLYRS